MKKILSSKTISEKNIIVAQGTIFNSSFISYEDESSEVYISDNCRLDDVQITINSGAKIIIGSMCQIRGRIIVSKNSCLKIGDGTVFNDAALIHVYEGGVITIGRDCLFANPRIYNSDMHAIFDRSSGDRINKARDVIISDRVWIATGAIILKGSNIGPDSVVGAGAVVSGKVPSNSVVAGNPAKIIKKNIVWSQIIKDKQKIFLDENFSVGTFRSAATKMDHDKVIELGFPLFKKWKLMDSVNYFIFYYLGRSLLEKCFVGNDKIDDISIFELKDMLKMAYESSNKKNMPCGAYTYKAALIAGDKDLAEKIYNEIYPVWPQIANSNFGINK